MIPLPQKQDIHTLTAGLIEGKDQKLSEIDVPEEHINLVQTGKFEQLKINYQGQQLTLMRKN